MKCRHCKSELSHQFIDLGFAPPSNAYLHPAGLSAPETYYPLRVMVCDQCWLVQTEDYAHHGELFNHEYAYFSSTSSSWLAHARRYVEDMVTRFHLGANSLVVELAANDGYLLQYVQQRDIPCVGIEPTRSTAAAARSKGIRIVEEFFGRTLATRLRASEGAADLIAANNVLAHVPDINDFVGGIQILLSEQGTATLEFPHLLNLLRLTQFDTIYHEHFSYLSLGVVERIATSQGLRVYDVEKLDTHGGSLRVYVCHQAASPIRSKAVDQVRDDEMNHGLESIGSYGHFRDRVEKVKLDVLSFLIAQKAAGCRVAAYGAAAKGNTLLNYCGVHADLLGFVADAAGAKQGKYMPGSHIPIVELAQLLKRRPDFVLILPWNIRQEVEQQLKEIRSWGGKFVVAIPELEIW
jgi:hypothetical protein